MTNAVAALAGPRFPWGTILINVIGSFVIGLFAYLTAPIGRLPVSFEMRAFVLVGICGGYTTFSAFSLQTLELARTGHWIEVAGNIVLSVVLCLAAVWAGYALAGGATQTPAA
jgi:fluoride exporter